MRLFAKVLAGVSVLLLVGQSGGISQTAQTFEGQLTEQSDTLQDQSYYNEYEIEGEEGEYFVIDLISEDFDAYLLLIDPEGNQIADDDDSGGSGNARIIISLPTTGTYRLLANTYKPGMIGRYSLSWRSASTSEIESIEAEQLSDQNTQDDEIIFHRNLGDLYYNSGLYDRALAAYWYSLNIARERGYSSEEAVLLNKIGRLYYVSNQYEYAADFYQQSIVIAQEIKNSEVELNSRGNLGQIYLSIDQYQKAIDIFQETIEVAQEVGSLDVEAQALTGLGRAYSALGMYSQAIKFHQSSIDISQEIGNQQAELNSIGSLAQVSLSIGEYQRAIELFQEALNISREISNLAGEAASLEGLGNAFNVLGQYEQAITFYVQSNEIARHIGSRDIEASSLSGLGQAYTSLGQYQRAIQFHQDSLHISRRIINNSGIAISLAKLGDVYVFLGQYRKALGLYQESLEIAEEINLRKGQASTLNNIGNAYRYLGQYDLAISSGQQSLEIARDIGDRYIESFALGNLGLVYYDRGQYERAIRFFQETLEISQNIKNQESEAISLSNLGNAHGALGQYEKLIEFNQKALGLAKQIKNSPREAIFLYNIGLGHLSLGRLSESEMALHSSIDVLESIRSGLEGESNDINRISIFDQQIRPYSLLQTAYVNQDKIDQALEISERSRARAFIELLTSRLSPEDPNLQVNPPNLSQIQQIAKEQNATLVEYSLINNNFDLDDEPGTESNRESTIYIWVITPTGQVTFRQVDLTPLWRDQDTDLNQLVQVTREFIGVRGTRTDASPELKPDIIASRQAETDQKLRQLHQLLIDPIADLLPTDPEAKVVFVPQDSLFSVPFPALKDAEGNYLIEKHTILTAPSIQTLQFTREAKTQNTDQSDNTLLVGNPTMPTVTFLTEEGFEDELLTSLPGAQQEAQAISDFLKTPALIGSSATEATVKQQIETANIIHFATHGLLEYGDPLQTGSRDVPGAIALTPGSGEDGLLTSSEILDMNLSADLVVLSACDTGRGRITGDGVIGLSRSFISAGVPSIIVSLWQVPDAPTAELMTEFYRQREQTGDNAQALRRAMLTTLQTHPDPKDWAAFTLIGEAD